MEVAVCLKAPCSTLLPGGLAAACLQAMGAVAATLIAIDEAGDDAEDDDDEDFVISARDDEFNALARVSSVSFGSVWYSMQSLFIVRIRF